MNRQITFDLLFYAKQVVWLPVCFALKSIARTQMMEEEA